MPLENQDSPFLRAMILPGVDFHLKRIEGLSVKWINKTFPDLPNPFATSTDQKNLWYMNPIYRGMLVAAMDICCIETVISSEDAKHCIMQLKDIRLNALTDYLFYRTRLLYGYFDGKLPFFDHLSHVEDTMEEQCQHLHQPKYLSGREKVLDHYRQHLKELGYQELYLPLIISASSSYEPN